MKSQIMFVIMLSLACPSAFAKDKKSTPQPTPTATPGVDSSTPPSEKLDVSDLENKYWAPKDTDFSVVQNRTFTKEHKLFISGAFGPDLTGGNYLVGNDIGVMANYFFNERYGVQLTYLDSYLHPDAAVGDLAGAHGVPNYGIMSGYYGAAFNWVPFYSKMSFLGKKILYFDMAISPTLGMTQYTQQAQAGNVNQNAFTYGFDITQYYFFTENFAFRLDLKNQWWTEQIIHNEHDSNGASGISMGSDHEREMILLLGFTYYFGFGK